MSKSSKGGAIMAGERVYCLYRVSTPKQVDLNEHNLADIPMQRKACREFAKKMGWDIIREEQATGGESRGDAVLDIVKAVAESATDPNKKSTMINVAMDQYSKGNIVMTPQGSFVGLLATKGIENILH